jgi:hypothetical protein
LDVQAYETDIIRVKRYARMHRVDWRRCFMRTKLFMLALGAGVILAGGSFSAHHSFASEFDANRPIKLRGTVTKMEWVNPHAWLHIAVKEPEGKVTAWMIEGAAPNAMLRRGFTKNSLPVGTEIIVEGFQAKDGSNTGSGRHLTFADGRTLFMSGAPDGPAR